MKKTNVKKYLSTTLLLLGSISMLGGCGNKGNSDFTKEEKDEINALFSEDERKELEAELGGGNFDSGSGKKEVEVTYDETITIDPFEGVTAVISGTLPYNADIKMVMPENEYAEHLDIRVADGIDMKSITAGDTVSVVADFKNTLVYSKENLEEDIQKYVELSKTVAEIEIIADTENYKKIFTSWDELTDEQKNELITYAIENIEEEIECQLFDTDEYYSNVLHSYTYTATEPIGVFWAVSHNDYETNNVIAISFDVTNDENYTMTIYFPFENVSLNMNTNEFEWEFSQSGMFSTKPGITDVTEIDDSRGIFSYPKTDEENFICEYISLTEEVQAEETTQVEAAETEETTQVEAAETEETSSGNKENKLPTFDELQFRVDGSEVVKLPITVAELYEKGFVMEEEVDLEEVYFRNVGYKSFVYVDENGNRTKSIGHVFITDITGMGSKLKDCYAVGLNIYIPDDKYEKVYYIGDLQAGVSTKEDILKTIGSADNNRFVYQYKYNGEKTYSVGFYFGADEKISQILLMYKSYCVINW